MELIKQAKFGNLVMDFYKDETGDIFATRKQIGECLNYSDPQKAIDKIHERRKDRLDKFSVTVSLGGTDNKQYNTTLYSARGITEICRRARTDNADEFFDWVTEVIEESIEMDCTCQMKQHMNKLSLMFQTSWLIWMITISLSYIILLKSS